MTLVTVSNSGTPSSNRAIALQHNSSLGGEGGGGHTPDAISHNIKPPYFIAEVYEFLLQKALNNNNRYHRTESEKNLIPTWPE